MENTDFRTDAEFFVKLPNENPSYRWQKIGDCLVSSQYGVSIEMNEDGDGYPIYRMNEIGDLLCQEEVSKYALLQSKDAAPFILKDRDVLFNRTNSQKFVGRTSLFLEFPGNEQRIFASYLVRLVPDKSKILPEYLVTFLNTKRGILDVKRRARISINQSNVNPEEVKAVKIPILSHRLQEEVRKDFSSAHKLFCTAQGLQDSATSFLLELVFLCGWQSPESLSYSRKFSEARQDNRLDAEHFLPRYKAMLDHVTKHAEKVCRIGDIASYCERGTQPEYFEDGELAVVTSKHILEHGLDYDNFDRTNADYWGRREFLSARIFRNDILTYTTGAKVGRTAAYLSDDRALASNHVNLIRVEKENALYVAAVMNSMVGRWQTNMSVSGSAQVELYPSDIRNFIIPFVPVVAQKKIAEQIVEAHHARQKAKALLECAKRAVEIAIEDSEEKALESLASARGGNA
ncbi:MAG: restriction endonuclease subunit S [Alphaproteobacteria bacterium]|nr:restriction endonuclease subunit S [Alphaproteobacteria bacterium]